MSARASWSIALILWCLCGCRQADPACAPCLPGEADLAPPEHGSGAAHVFSPVRIEGLAGLRWAGLGQPGPPQGRPALLVLRQPPPGSARFMDTYAFDGQGFARRQEGLLRAEAPLLLASADMNGDDRLDLFVFRWRHDDLNPSHAVEHHDYGYQPDGTLQRVGVEEARARPFSWEMRDMQAITLTQGTRRSFHLAVIPPGPERSLTVFSGIAGPGLSFGGARPLAVSNLSLLPVETAGRLGQVHVLSAGADGQPDLLLLYERLGQLVPGAGGAAQVPVRGDGAAVADLTGDGLADALIGSREGRSLALLQAERGQGGALTYAERVPRAALSGQGAILLLAPLWDAGAWVALVEAGAEGGGEARVMTFRAGLRDGRLWAEPPRAALDEAGRPIPALRAARLLVGDADGDGRPDLILIGADAVQVLLGRG